MQNNLTIKILIFMVAGAVFGIILKYLLLADISLAVYVKNIMLVGGDIFISLMQMLVIPIIFVSIVAGICSLEKTTIISNIGLKSFKWFMITTVSAVLLAIIVASIFNLGSNLHLETISNESAMSNSTPSLWQLISGIFTSNPLKSMAEGNVLQVIVFSIMFGLAINTSGEPGRRIAAFFADLNVIIMKFIMKLVEIVPYGVFCLIAHLFATQGFTLILDITTYFIMALFVLFLHTAVTLSTILHFFNISPKVFFKKMYPVMLFAFGTSSSNASIPIALNTVENKLGVSKAVSSFVVPFGINVNKNGTAIIQCIATIFIANAYHIQIGFIGYITLLLMVILVSIGTAGVPNAGMITLIMILKQLGLPIEGISLIIGIDRVLDMVRTAINVTSNAMVACLVGSDEGQIDYRILSS